MFERNHLSVYFLFILKYVIELTFKINIEKSNTPKNQ